MIDDKYNFVTENEKRSKKYKQWVKEVWIHEG